MLTSLGPAADSFVLAGAQALKFLLPRARATRDFDFVRDVVALREATIPIATILEKLGYVAIPGAQNFQFQKAIPDSTEIMRIEFMAPSEYKRKNDFRVDVQANLHAHACDGGKIVLAESELRELSGQLPSGHNATVQVRVTLPHSLVPLKCLAMDDRYRNVRGPEHAEHDKSEALTHVEDIVAVLTAQTTLSGFRSNFSRQFKCRAVSEVPRRSHHHRLLHRWEQTRHSALRRALTRTYCGPRLARPRLAQRTPARPTVGHELFGS